MKVISVGFFHGQKQVVIMPSKTKKPYAYPGCPSPTHDSYCEEHKALRFW